MHREYSGEGRDSTDPYNDGRGGLDLTVKADMPDHLHATEASAELLEARFVELDPVADGFLGAFVELSLDDDGIYILRVVAAATGNRLLTFATRSAHLSYTLFEEEIRAASG